MKKALLQHSLHTDYASLQLMALAHCTAAETASHRASLGSFVLHAFYACHGTFLAPDADLAEIASLISLGQSF